MSVSVSRSQRQAKKVIRYADLSKRGADYERFWTPREDETLRKCYRERLSRKVISERLGRSVQAIGCRASDLGLSRPCGKPWSQADSDAIAKQWKDGSPTAIGVELNRSINAVVGKAYRMGLEPKKKSPRAGSRRGGSNRCGCTVGVQSRE